MDKQTMRKLELVEWTDANFRLDPDPDYSLDADYTVATVGWVEERNEWLVVVSEVTPDGERSVTRIPKANVVNRQRLKLKKNGSS